MLAKELQDKVFDSVTDYLSTGKSSANVGTQNLAFQPINSPMPSGTQDVAFLRNKDAVPQENKKPVNFLDEDKKDYRRNESNYSGFESNAAGKIHQTALRNRQRIKY